MATTLKQVRTRLTPYERRKLLKVAAHHAVQKALRRKRMASR